MPIISYPVKLTGPESYSLADMAGVHHDLRLSAAITAQMGRRREKSGFDDMLELEALQDSALTHYGRCFRGGVRTAFLIPLAWIDELPPDLRQGHSDFLDLRDKHVAHSVNDWELNIPVARVRIDQETDAIDTKSRSMNRGSLCWPRIPSKHCGDWQQP